MKVWYDSGVSKAVVKPCHGEFDDDNGQDLKSNMSSQTCSILWSFLICLSIGFLKLKCRVCLFLEFLSDCDYKWTLLKVNIF